MLHYLPYIHVKCSITLTVTFLLLFSLFLLLAVQEIDFYVAQTKSSVHGNKIIVIYLSMILSILFLCYYDFRKYTRDEDRGYVQQDEFCVCVWQCLCRTNAYLLFKLLTLMFTIFTVKILWWHIGNNGVKTDTLANNNNSIKVNR